MKEMPEQFRARYDSALHRMMAAIGFDMSHQIGLVAGADDLARILKHMRTGTDSVFSSQRAVVDLLLEKGVFTEEEFYEAITVGAEREADDTVARVQARYGLERVEFA